MLLELKIRNFAILEAVEIRLGAGLNVLTGETGAGKSIVMSALQWVLGGRSDRDLVRTGASEAWAEAVFSMTPKIRPLLEDAGLPVEEDVVVIRRSLQQGGRSRSWLNCASVSVALLKQISASLVDFGRQHDQGMLMEPRMHLHLLDRYAGLEPLRLAVSEAYDAIKELQRERQKLVLMKATRAERRAFLDFQLASIKEVDPQKGEIEEMQSELSRLEEAKNKKALAKDAEGILWGGEGSIQSPLSSALRSLEKLAALESEAEPIYQTCNEAAILLEEAGRSLKSLQRRLETDPQRLEEIEDRLDALHALSERHGGTLDAVFQRVEEIQAELKQIAKEDSRISEISKQIEDAFGRWQAAAQPLSEGRQDASTRLCDAVLRELSDLAMSEAQFSIRFRPLDAPASSKGPSSEGASDEAASPEETEDFEIFGGRRISPVGLERGSFYLAANPGEEARPLDRVASGGEMSRILLAMKRALAGISDVSTLIFDEIEAGVAGLAVTKVARKLKQIADDGDVQILCISHTPQIAAEADLHLHVRKEIRQGRTLSLIDTLQDDERLHEIARMLAGDQSLEQALTLARRMLRIPHVEPAKMPLPPAFASTL